MRARAGAFLAIAATALLAGYMLLRASALFRAGGVDGIGLGIGVVLLVAVGLFTLVDQLRFGIATERLGRALAAEGGLPEALPAAPSGRADRDAADAAFEVRKAEAEAAPDDWRVWYRLAVAYADARDSKRGRTAMRRAIALHRAA